MLKGVNKSIVEINDTGNMYFEKMGAKNPCE